MWCSLFCFYKQKTAYEMRISDWSSDVCSSDLRHHLIIAHDVINVGSDRAQLARMDKEAKAILEAESLEVVADRGYFDSGEILACAEADITITLPKPMTSDNRVRGRFETVEHPFGTIKARMGATHFLMKRLPNVATEMSQIGRAHA